jgi:hypothetical protein
MMIPRWLARCAIWLPAILLFAFAASKFPVIAVFVTLVCGLAGVVYLITTRRSMSPVEPEQEREKYRYLRDIPPPGG